MRGWFLKNEFDKFDINQYVQKYPTPTGTEHEMTMGGEKKVSDYVKFHISIFMRVYNMRDIEIVQEGKKMKLQEGQVQIEIKPKLQLDYQRIFEGKGAWGKFLMYLGEFYRKYIIKYKISDYWEDMLFEKAVILADTIKDALGQEVR